MERGWRKSLHGDQPFAAMHIVINPDQSEDSTVWKRRGTGAFFSDNHSSMDSKANHRVALKLRCEDAYRTTPWSFFGATRKRSGGGGGYGRDGMHAMFMDSCQRSMGTGFFLPRRSDDSTDGDRCTMILNYTPVLLPLHVMQQLIKRRARASSPSPFQEGGLGLRNTIDMSRGGGNRNGDMVCNFSIDAMLPEDWNYYT